MFSAFFLIGTLVVSAVTPAVPTIDLAFVERRGSHRAELLIREADTRLMARCFDPMGQDAHEIERAQKAAIGQTIWLYQGPRRIARGRIDSLEVRADSALPCVVVATASFDRPLPLVARGDLLWATTRRFESHPREPVGQDVIERARKALPAGLATACLDRQAVVRRGTRSGIYVGFVCLRGGAPISSVVFVPKKGDPRVSLMEHGEYGALTLIEVLNPWRTDRHRLILSREWPPLGARRLEVWEDDGFTARPATSESLFGDMMFLMAETSRAEWMGELPGAQSEEGQSLDQTTSPESPEQTN